jgi:hypothetical protein
MSKKQKDDVFTSEKPEWDAERWPWAVWRAQDADGSFHWFEREPRVTGDRWQPTSGRSCLAGYPDDLLHPDWANSLEAKPT